MMTSRVMQDFNLLLPESIPQTLDLLSDHQKNAAVMAGGTDLLLALKFDYAIDHVISLAFVSGLDQLSFIPGEGLTIGAKVTIADILNSVEVRQYYPALWQAAKTFATPQLRNTATVLGNILRGSPAGDSSLAAFAYGGKITLQNKKGSRQVSLDDFWLSYGVTARRNDELAVSLHLPALPPGHKSAFQRITRTHEDLSKIGAAVCLQMDGNLCQGARVVMGCVGPTLVRLPQTEEMLEGSEISAELLTGLSNIVPREIKPIDDKRSTADYRLKVSGTLVKRVIEKALNGDDIKGDNQ